MPKEIENVNVISVAREFGRYPAGRFRSDGPYSGEHFRDDLLVPALRSLARGDRLRVDLDGVRGYGSSFLEEAFGGLVRMGLYSEEELSKSLEFGTVDDSLVLEIRQYIAQAEGPNAK